MGNSSFGVIHCFFELFGPNKTKHFITAVTRLCLAYLKRRGFSTDMEDLELQLKAEEMRKVEFGKLREKVSEELKTRFDLKECDLTEFIKKTTLLPEKDQ